MNGVRPSDDGIPGYGDLLFLSYNGGPDTIGLSADDYDSVDSNLQSIFFDAGPVLRDIADIVTSIDASEYLNYGGELIKDARGRYFLYTDGTEMRPIYQRLGVEFPEYYEAYTYYEHYADLENYI